MGARVRDAIKLEVLEIDGALGVTFPKDVSVRLCIKKGDTIFLTETAEGYLLTTGDPDFKDQMDVAREVMHKRRNALKDLAK